MLQNEYLIATIGVDTAENEPWKECWVVALRRSTPPERGMLQFCCRSDAAGAYRSATEIPNTTAHFRAVTDTSPTVTAPRDLFHDMSVAEKFVDFEEF